MSDRRSLTPSERPSLSGKFLERLETKQPGEELSETARLSVRAPMASFSGATLPPQAPEPKQVAAPRPARVYLETIVITALFPAVGYAIDSHDPFFLTHSFSWLAVAPILIALRHGFALGFASAMATDLAVAFFWRTVLLQDHMPFPGEVVVGMIAMTMIAGQFSDVFRRDTQRFRRGLQTARRRLDTLSRAHFLLELSHERMAQQRGPAAPNLRDAIVAAGRLLRGGTSLADIAPALLEIYGAYFSVEVASLHDVNNDVMAPDALAVIGKPRVVKKSDALLKDALAQGLLTYLPAALARGAHPSTTALLAAVPFVDTGGKLRAVLAVESMPFVAFERKNLEAMVVLGGHVADLFVEETIQHGGRANLEFVLERALLDLRSASVPATLALLRVSSTGRANDLVDIVMGSALRELDFPYSTRDDSGDLLVYVLLPMSDEAVALALFDRMTKMVARELDMTMAGAGARFAYHVLTALDTVDSALEHVERRVREDALGTSVRIAR